MSPPGAPSLNSKSSYVRNLLEVIAELALILATFTLLAVTLLPIWMVAVDEPLIVLTSIILPVTEEPDATAKSICAPVYLLV